MLKERSGETCLIGLSGSPVRILGKDRYGIRWVDGRSAVRKYSIDMSAGEDLHNADLKIR